MVCQLFVVILKLIEPTLPAPMWCALGGVATTNCVSNLFHQVVMSLTLFLIIISPELILIMHVLVTDATHSFDDKNY